MADVVHQCKALVSIKHYHQTVVTSMHAIASQAKTHAHSTAPLQHCCCYICHRQRSHFVRSKTAQNWLPWYQPTAFFSSCKDSTCVWSTQQQQQHRLKTDAALARCGGSAGLFKPALQCYRLHPHDFRTLAEAWKYSACRPGAGWGTAKHTRTCTRTRTGRQDATASHDVTKLCDDMSSIFR